MDGYRCGGKDYDRTEVIARLQREMPSLEKTVVVPYLNGEPDAGALEGPQERQASMGLLAKWNRYLSVLTSFDAAHPAAGTSLPTVSRGRPT